MKKQEFKERLQDRILILDGVFGTMLQPHLPAGACVDHANLEKPDLVAEIHRAYRNAGADLLSTNTFGANRIKLDEFKLGHKTREINGAAVRLAAKHAEGRLVTGVIGPTGRLVEPMGPLTFDEAYDVFREQALALAEGGIDLFLLETFSDLKEIRIALLAIRDNTDLPVMACMTYGEDFLTFTGTDPVTAANVLRSMGADAVGVNCSTGPEPMLEVLGRYAAFTDVPLLVEPNAGIPRLTGNTVSYSIGPDEMAGFAEKFVQIGANIVGTCCGSTPEFTARLSGTLKKSKPVPRHTAQTLSLSSRTRTVQIGPGLPFCIAGERINPTNREDLIEALTHDRISVLQNEARAETQEGAHLLDVNIGVPGLDDVAMMGKVIRGIENVSAAPLVIDSTNPAAIEAALRETPGKVLINSVHGSPESMETIIPLAARYGAGLLCLAVGESGIPKTAEERIDVLRQIIERTDAAGIPREHLICDCLTLTVSAQQKRAEATLKAIQLVKQDLGLPAILGVSNISFGLPERSLINATFLSMAMSAGLDAAIMNPGDMRMMETVRAASVLTVRDRDSRIFVSSHQKKKKSSKPETDSAGKDSGESPVYRAVLSGNRDEIASLVENELGQGASAFNINNDLLIPAIQEVGRQYDRKEIFLPQMILAAETMQKAFEVLEPHFGKGDVRTAGKVILCTVRGDVHDIGKNIVGLFLKNEGFEVIDLGKDVARDEIVARAKQHQADVVGLSALMTTTMTEMPGVIRALKEAELEAKTIIGGAVVTKTYAREIGADAYAKDALEAVGQVKALVAS
ncbi:homocysteine S-methyltransferase family protein [bacterium]|nr:homocysteine S-methyltransferase family protein [bacterium]